MRGGTAGPESWQETGGREIDIKEPAGLEVHSNSGSSQRRRLAASAQPFRSRRAWDNQLLGGQQPALAPGWGPYPEQP